MNMATGRAVEQYRKAVKLHVKMIEAEQELEQFLRDPEVEWNEYVRLTTEIDEAEGRLLMDLDRPGLAPSSRQQMISRELNQAGRS